MYMARSVGLIEECTRNRLILEHNIILNKHTLPFYVALTRDANGTIHYQNLASIIAWHDKRHFLEIVVRHIPTLLWQHTLRCEPAHVEVMTPLDAAVYLQNTSLVSHILALPQLHQYAETDPTGYVSLINKSITYADDKEREILALLEEKKRTIGGM